MNTSDRINEDDFLPETVILEPKPKAETTKNNAQQEDNTSSPFDAETVIATLKTERDEARDKMLRAFAELENFRVRVNRERIETLKYASIDLMRDLLPVWDNMNRALEAAEKSRNIESLDSLIYGVRMIEEQFVSALAKHHCKKIESLGKPFDPNFHASVAQLPSDQHDPNSVMHETQTGFILHDRIVRPAQVVLATEKEASRPSQRGSSIVISP